MSEKLEKCPFCGGEAMPAEVEQIEHSGWVGRIECGTCDAVFSTQYSANSPGKAGNEVIEAWNRRALESRASNAGEAVADERAAFEGAYASNLNAQSIAERWGLKPYTVADIAAMRVGDSYQEGHHVLNACWTLWQARAALATAQMWQKDGLTDQKIIEIARQHFHPVVAGQNIFSHTRHAGHDVVINFARAILAAPNAPESKKEE